MNQKEFLSKYYSGVPNNSDVNDPAGSITTIDHHALVQSEFLLKYNSTAANGDQQHSVMSIDNPSPTIPAQRQPNLVQTDFLHTHYSNSDIILPTDTACPTIPCADILSKVNVEWLDKGYSGERNHQATDKPAGAITGSDKYALLNAEWIDKQFTSGGRDSSIDDPLGSVMPVPKANLVQTQFIEDTQFNNAGKSLDAPLGTITANRKWHYLMNPQYFNNGGSIDKPCFTLIARMDKMPPYLVQTESGNIAIEVYESDTLIMRKIKHFMALYGIADIKMRMLKVVELKRIQGFPEDYVLKGNQADQKKFIGNSVVPHVVKAWAQCLVHRLNENKLSKTA